MSYEVQVRELPAQHVAAVKKRTSLTSIGQDIQAAMAELSGTIAPQGIVPAGPPFLIMHDTIEEETEGEIELCVPVAEPFAGGNAVYGRDVEATTAATTTHRGPYDQVGPAYQTLMGWVQEHGREVVGPPREVYLTDPRETPDPADYLTEIALPIR
jgi:effector-binding domain-containing protein